MTDRWNPAIHAYEPTPNPPPPRRDGQAADLLTHQTVDDHRAHGDRVRELERQGAYRDHQPGLPAGMPPTGVQAARQLLPGLGRHIAQAQRNLSLARPGGRADAQGFLDELTAAMNGGFSSMEPRLQPRDQRDTVWDEAAYSRYEEAEHEWRREHSAHRPDQAFDLTLADLAKALHRSPRSLRRWEAEAALPPARRSPTGARLYSRELIDGLAIIAQDEGLLSKHGRQVHPADTDFPERAHNLAAGLGV